MVASFAIIRSTGYYTSRTSALDYYAGGESRGVWLRGHEQLGVAAGEPVQRGDFDRICAGLDAGGNRLGKTASTDRMFGVDITLSSPKSVSVLYALGDLTVRQTIAQAEREAVEATLRLIEAEIPLARRGHNGARREHASFTAAVFTHDEARPEEHADGTVMPSPQRHHHVCIPSLAERPDGSWGAIDSVGLRSWKKGLGAIYRLQLATALQERGFAIEHADDDWRWSIVGVPKRLCKFFSARRTALEEELAQAGLTSAAAPARAAAINLSNRHAKRAWDNADLTHCWQEAARGQGFRPENVVADTLAAGRTSVLEPDERSRLQDERIATVPGTLTEHTATFSRLALIEVAANALVGTATSAEGAIDSADRLVSSEQVIPLTQTRDGTVYSTPQMLAAEKALVELAGRMAHSHVAAPSPGVVENLLNGMSFNPEQQDVIRAATTGKRLVHIQGAAGTGKSTTLEAITRTWQAAGYQVAGAAVAWRAANALGKDLGIEARAIDSWLSRIERGGEPFTSKTCLIVEEAGLQSTPQALRLLEAVDRSGGVVVSVGDENQLRPVGPGHAARLIREAIGAVELSTIVRQREAWARQAPMAFARGDARPALDAFAERGLLQMCDGPRATVEALADRWQQLADARPDESVLVTAKTNAEVRALSAALRNRQRQRGIITGPETAIEAVDASGNPHVLRIAAGDRIRFLARNDALRVVNGTEARVIAVETDQDSAIRISAETDGRSFSFSPDDIADDRGRARISSALAATIALSQGLTVDRCVVWLSSRFDRHDAYVAASRARETTEFFVDRRALDRELDEAGSQSTSPDIGPERMAHLAARLSRISIKTNALDVIAAETAARTRRRELARVL